MGGYESVSIFVYVLGGVVAAIFVVICLCICKTQCCANSSTKKRGYKKRSRPDFFGYHHDPSFGWTTDIEGGYGSSHSDGSFHDTVGNGGGDCDSGGVGDSGGGGCDSGGGGCDSGGGGCDSGGGGCDSGGGGCDSGGGGCDSGGGCD
ncbi:TATA-binding protein-associated factor 2N-like [Ixodes scapularis]|uniref:TATA-binding protein-associated factor 2N-like n=1 Tax=Ixodes scapularis TaxID=6945 RepID=UPI001C37F4A3|nr:TATA-binding protein-associated factor 2N-like [Ixodes scapularis]